MSTIHISSSPHFTKGNSTTKIMLTVLISLLPECIYGVAIFGIHALVNIIAAVVSCVAFEALFQFITKQKISITNLSAAVTGVLLALVIPSSTPIWMTVLGSAVAVVIAKGLFGGLGANVFNPALTGRAFMFISFAAVMGASWFNPDVAPQGAAWNWNASSINAVDAISSATTLSQIKSGALTPDSSIYLKYFLGNRAGCIGETSILLILISFVFLLVTKTIDWRAPVAMVGTVTVLSFITGLVQSGSSASALNTMIMSLLTGGLLFGATFMVTDYATAPVTKPGRLIFGAGCGLITYLIRTFGGYPEGVMFSILIMNSVAPFLNNITYRKYGYGKKGHRKPEPRKIVQDFDVANAKTEEVK